MTEGEVALSTNSSWGPGESGTCSLGLSSRAVAPIVTSRVPEDMADALLTRSFSSSLLHEKVAFLNPMSCSHSTSSEGSSSRWGRDIATDDDESNTSMSSV